MRQLIKQLFAVKSDKPDALSVEMDDARARNDAAANALEKTMRSLLDSRATLQTGANRG